MSDLLSFVLSVCLSVRPSVLSVCVCVCVCVRVCVFVVCCVLCCVVVVAHACTAESVYARDACTPHVTVGLTLRCVMLRSAGVGLAILVDVDVVGTNRSGKCPSGCEDRMDAPTPPRCTAHAERGVGARVLRVVAASIESR